MSNREKQVTAMTVPVLKWSLKTSPPKKLQKDIPVPLENSFNLMELVI